MHTVSTEERNGEYRFVCSCGTTGNWYGNQGIAYNTGYAHKQAAEGNPSDSGNSNDDPRVGW